MYSTSGFADPATLGNNLADYFDNGGQVVVATFANASVPLAGRFVSGDYLTFLGNDQKTVCATLGTIGEPPSPLLRGVQALSNPGVYLAQTTTLASRPRGPAAQRAPVPATEVEGDDLGSAGVARVPR